jgi:hypothetical protein
MRKLPVVLLIDSLPFVAIRCIALSDSDPFNLVQPVTFGTFLCLRWDSSTDLKLFKALYRARPHTTTPCPILAICFCRKAGLPQKPDARLPSSRANIAPAASRQNLSQPPNVGLDHYQALKHYYRFQSVSAIFKNLSLLLALMVQPPRHGLTCV